MNVKQKLRIRIQQMNKDIFLNQILFPLVYTNQNVESKRLKIPRYYLRKRIIDNYNVIINGKKIVMTNSLVIIFLYQKKYDTKKLENKQQD